jgi:hypothetical protein
MYGRLESRNFGPAPVRRASSFDSAFYAITDSGRLMFLSSLRALPELVGHNAQPLILARYPLSWRVGLEATRGLAESVSLFEAAE